MKFTIKQKEIYLRLVVIIVPLTIISLIMCFSKAFDNNYFISENYKDVQFNILTINSILIGFMFTSLGIFISASEIPSIKKEHAYVKYDLLASSIIIGLASISISLIINLLAIFINYDLFYKLSTLIVFLELFTLILGISLFITTIHDLFYIIKRIRNKK
jgi:hypothetical protein